MKPVRTLVTAIALILAVAGAAAAPVFASSAHQACTSKPHDCCKAAKVAPACCRVQSDTSDQSAPAQGKVRVPADSDFIVPASARASESETIRIAFRARTSPRAAPVDLSTLFACLLI